MTINDSTYVTSAGMPAFEGVGAGGGLGNRVNATVLFTDMRAIQVAREASMRQLVGQGTVGRILNVTI